MMVVKKKKALPRKRAPKKPKRSTFAVLLAALGDAWEARRKTPDAEPDMGEYLASVLGGAIVAAGWNITDQRMPAILLNMAVRYHRNTCRAVDDREDFARLLKEVTK